MNKKYSYSFKKNKLPATYVQCSEWCFDNLCAFICDNL